MNYGLEFAKSLYSSLPVDRRCRDAGQALQLRLAARPPTRSDVVRHAKCKHALEVFLNDMRYINPRFTYSLTYLLTRCGLLHVTKPKLLQ